MKESTLHVLGGAALAGGGVYTATFWMLEAAIGSFVGVSAVRHPLWSASQWLHLSGALLTLFGLMALYGVHRQHTGVPGLVGFALAAAGAALSFAEGFAALVIFPALARATPWVLSPAGAMNSGGVRAAFMSVAVVNLVGLTVFTLAMLRACLFPRTAWMLFLAGGVLVNLPPGSLPMPLPALGGVLWGAGAVWLGLALQARAHEPATGGTRLGTGS